MYYIYRFIDKKKNVIYVGKSKQELEQRFKGHFHLPDECYKLVYKIEYIKCSTESDMSIKEIYYINKFRNPNCFFNLQDTTELPKSVSFNDKWRQYKGFLDSHFPNSLNFKKGYGSEKEIIYNKDGSICMRKSYKRKGVSSFVEGFTSDEVNLMINQFIHDINESVIPSYEKFRFRNLLMFMISINLPIKTTDLLNLKYKDFFNERDKFKPLEMKLSRLHKDITLKIPLRKNIRKLILAYIDKYSMTYSNNAEDYFFESRERGPVDPRSWWRILSDTADAVGITKNIGAESIRKTYGLNVYNKSDDKLKALLFLGELWSGFREVQIIKYLNLSDDKIDFNHYFGEDYALGNVRLSKIECLNNDKNIGLPKKQDTFIKSYNSKKNNSLNISNSNVSTSTEEKHIRNMNNYIYWINQKSKSSLTDLSVIRSCSNLAIQYGYFKGESLFQCDSKQLASIIKNLNLNEDFLRLNKCRGNRPYYTLQRLLEYMLESEGQVEPSKNVLWHEIYDKKDN